MWSERDARVAVQLDNARRLTGRAALKERIGPKGEGQGRTRVVEID
jgi:hypothetical protein